MVFPLPALLPVVVVVVVAATLHTTGGITADTDLDSLTCMHAWRWHPAFEERSGISFTG